MRTSVLVCGATGSVGRAVVNALIARGHRVVRGGRSAVDGPNTLHVDFSQPVPPDVWAARLAAARVDAVVNCVGILMPSPGQSFERVHAQGPIELFEGAARAGLRSVVQVSALGVRHDAVTQGTPYLRSKGQADDALAALPVGWAVLRPSLIYGPHSQSAALFATLASLPVVSLPGRGAQRVQPIHVYEVAEAVVRALESAVPLNRVLELGGPQTLSYRDMLAAYRDALGLGPALWLPLPMPLMRATAWLAEALPQRVFCRDTIGMLERGSVPAPNDAPELLGREPTALAPGLAVSRPVPMVDLRVQVGPGLHGAMRLALAFMWIYTSAITLAWPAQSGVLNLLARCGFEGMPGVVVMVLSCGLNLLLGALVVLRPTPWTYALNVCAVLGYTAMAAFHMPELTIDHCGPLVKNVPVLALVTLLWLSNRPMPLAERAAAVARGLRGTADARRA